MAKQATYYVCEKCGHESLKWSGQCSSCHEWNTLKEFNVSKSTRERQSSYKDVRSYGLSDIADNKLKRFHFGLPGTENVLGGGLPQGALILLGGDPGVGKSTLLLNIASRAQTKVLYVSAEESLEQVKDRALRIETGKNELRFLAEADLDGICAVIDKEKPEIVIIDSIQTVYDPKFPATAGSLVQVRESTLRLQTLAKHSKTTFLIVSHVTKDGAIAGPKILEHIVDGVFYLEKEGGDWRLLRSVKNRFGTTAESVVLEMNAKGIAEVAHPEGIFLADRVTELPGSAVTTVAEGSRILLVEIQALVSPAVFGYPRRSAVGIHPQRLELVLAVLERRAKVNLRNFDVFIKATADFVAREASTDLAVALALVSAQKNKPIAKDWCVFGEVGLLGELRYPRDKEIRFKAAKSLGFEKFINDRTLAQAIETVFSTKS